jgi:protein-tyrosine phosphatase
VLDLHTHILPGLDDGARTLEKSVAMARTAVGDGIHALAATPHVRSDFPTTASQMEAGAAELRSALVAEGVELDVLTGGEIALDQLPALADAELTRFGLAGNPGYLLLEFPYYGWPLDLETRMFELRTKGFGIVLAHPERNAEVQAAPERLERLVEHEALVQLTAASIDGRLGRRSRDTAFRLLELGLAHLLASDAHAPGVRAMGLASAAEAVADEALARWLTESVPAAIVAGAAIPERPPVQRSSRRAAWRRR